MSTKKLYYVPTKMDMTTDITAGEPLVTYYIIHVTGNVESVDAWCRETFGLASDRWFRHFDTFYFSNQEDAMIFVLQWT